MGTAAAGVSCPATGVGCAIAPSAAAACTGAVTVAIAVCSVTGGNSPGTGTRMHGNSADSMIGTEVYYLINNTTGDIDKIGITSYPDTRYSKRELIEQNLRYTPQAYYDWRTMAIIDEQYRLLQYYMDHGRLPRLNKAFR
jgi:hypothetical protein